MLFDFIGKELVETLPKEVNLGMFELYCEDLIQNLHRKTGVLRESILRKMSQDHQVNICRCIKPFNSIFISSQFYYCIMSIVMSIMYYV